MLYIISITLSYIYIFNKFYLSFTASLLTASRFRINDLFPDITLSYLVVEHSYINSFRLKIKYSYLHPIYNLFKFMGPTEINDLPLHPNFAWDSQTTTWTEDREEKEF